MPKDILKTESGELKIVNGDIVIGDSTLQHQRDILLSRKCDIRNKPSLAVGLQDYRNDEGITNGNNNDLTTAIRREFKRDGMTVYKIDLKDTINAKYND